jgi:hypothetical protein
MTIGIQYPIELPYMRTLDNQVASNNFESYRLRIKMPNQFNIPVNQLSRMELSKCTSSNSHNRHNNEPQWAIDIFA